MPLRRVEHAGLGVVWYHFGEPESDTHAGFRHAIITRLGGTSGHPFDSLNLGSGVGDSDDAVRANHERLFHAMGLSQGQVVSPHQVHGRRVAVVGPGDGGSVIPETDALVTDQPGLALLLRFADCVPVLFYDSVHHVVALAHAGWRGVAAEVVVATVSTMAGTFGSNPQDLWAGIGPAIGPDHYIVGEEVVTAVQRTVPAETQIASRTHGQWHVDLAGAVYSQLIRLGLTRVDQAAICTACHTSEWYSHRAEAGKTGRFGVLAMLT